MTKYKIILNPNSARGMGGKSIERIKERLQGHHLDFDIATSERVGHAIELAQQAVKDGYDVVVAAGGDGTANEVANGLMLAKKAGVGEATFALLGIGRGNDFAFGADIPTDFEEACQLLVNGRRQRIDVGWITGGLYPEGRYFINGVGIGFDATINYEASKVKIVSGAPSYLIGAIKALLFYYLAPLARFEVNDSKVFEQHALLVTLMNGKRLGGAFLLSPNAILDDGLLDFVSAGKISRPRILTLLGRSLKGEHIGQPEIRFERIKKLSVTVLGEGVLPAQADGEVCSLEGKQLTVEILPQAMEIICK